MMGDDEGGRLAHRIDDIDRQSLGVDLAGGGHEPAASVAPALGTRGEHDDLLMIVTPLPSSLRSALKVQSA
jgi:hypothetical protein